MTDNHFLLQMRSHARITSPHSILSAVLMSHIKSQVTWGTQHGKPAPSPCGAQDRYLAAQQGKIVRNWLESTNPHSIQAVFGEEILILFFQK